MTVEFDLFGIYFRAWYALSESQTRNVLRISTKGRPTREQYAAARERAAVLLKEKCND